VSSIVIATRPFKRILGEREEIRVFLRRVCRGKGVHGNGEEHHDESEKAVASPPRDRDFIGRFCGAGGG
jgi:hypothetical protein